MQTLIQDVRFAMRMFRRRPAFMLSILTVLGFGIGSSTTIFSVVDGVLLKPLPYRDPENLVRIFGVWHHGSSEGISAPHFRESRSAGGVFESIAAAASTTPLVSLTAAGDPEQIVTRSISAGFFSTLGVQPLLGREFRPEEEVFKGPRAVLLSFDLWQRQYAGETKIVGRALKVNNYPYTIVGVMPPVFNFLGAADLFTPLQQNPYQDSRSARTLVMIGRLKAGATLQQAQQQLDSFALNQQAGYPGEETGWSAAAMPLTDEVVRDVKPALTMLVGAVALVLLVASSNVAGMMLSQTTRRTAEISLRHSLGASKTRVLRQLLTESLTLALAGGALGCLLAIGGVEVIKRFGL